jgi:four helix bundle protein
MRQSPVIRSHKDLRVWQEAMDLVIKIFTISKSFPADERFSLVDQIRRSSRSAPANISEAWRKRRYAAAFVSKLNDAEGEAAETQTHLEIARRCGYVSDSQAQALDARYELLLGQFVTMANRPEVWTTSCHPPVVSQSPIVT